MPGSVGQPTQAWFPWVASKSNVGYATRFNDGTNLGAGGIQNTPAINDEIVWDLYMDSVTYKFACVHYDYTSAGIASLQLDGVTVGTIDMYAAANVDDQYDEVTGITVSAAGVKAFKILMASKNASSTNYYGILQSCAWIKTSGTHSTPGGTDTPGYTWEWIPWMGSKATVGFTNRSQGSTKLSGGHLGSSGTQNDEVSCDIWLDTGTFKYAQITETSPSRGIYHIQLNAVEKATIDGYVNPGAENTYAEVTGITVATAGVNTLNVKMATKNASSTNYVGMLYSVKWIRTGA